MIFRCDLQKQYMRHKAEIDSAIKKVLRSGKYTLGEEVSKFEEEFARYCGCKYAVGVGNATDGIILSLKAMHIGPGDEVITTPFTAIPTVSAIIATGAKPVFVDIDEKTYLLDLHNLSKLITPATKAILPVHIFGNVVDIDNLKTVIPKQILIIEDSAQAHGSKINGKQAGSIGEIGVFSFYPTKNLGGYGDGGAVVTNNIHIEKKIRLMRMYGMLNKDRIIINGINSRLDEIQAAILRVKLKYLDEMNHKRNQIAKTYQKYLRNTVLTFQNIPSNIYCNYHVLAARVSGSRKKFMDYLKKEMIQTNIYYPIPQHLQKANQYLGYKKGDLPVAELVCKQVIALPMYPELTNNNLNRIINTIERY